MALADDLLRPIAEAPSGNVAQVVYGVRDQRPALNQQSKNHLEDHDSALSLSSLDGVFKSGGRLSGAHGLGFHQILGAAGSALDFYRPLIV